MDRIEALAAASKLLQEPGPYTKEKSSKVDSLLALADASKTDDGRRVIMAQRDAELGLPPYVRPAAPDPRGDEMVVVHGRGVRVADLPQYAEFQAYLRSGRVANIKGAQDVGTGSQGGYLVPQVFSDRVFEVMASFDELFQLCTRWTSANGSASPYPVLDDFSSGGVPVAAAIVNENAASVEGDITFASVAFEVCPKWGSGGYVPCSMELLQDSKFPIDSIIAQAFGKRFAHGFGAYCITKILAAAPAGVTTASASAIAPDEIWELTESLDPAYLPNAAFLMNQTTFSAIMRLKATTNSYIFPPTFNAAGRPTLCGRFPVYLSPSMPAMTAGLQPIAFGDLSTFVVREVRDSLTTLRLVQKFALLGQVAFLGFWRIDGAQLLGSAGPVAAQTLTMHS